MNERRIVLSKIIALIVALLSSSLVAQTLPLRQFQHTAWTLQDGAPSQIFALAQTTDGYLWLGTVNGLFQFDGVSFERYRLPHGQQFLHTAIRSLTATENGELWIGYTMGDVSVLKDGILKNLKSNDLRGSGTVFSIVIVEDGTVWAATNNGPIHFFSGKWHDPEEVKETDIKTAYFLTQDRQGTIWVTGDDAVYRLARGSHRFEKTRFRGGGGSLVLDDPEGALWMTELEGFHAYNDRRDPVDTHRDFFPYPDNVTDCRFDQTGALWIMGAKTGVTRVPKPHDALNLSVKALSSATEHFGASNGLTSDRALATLEDREGNIWVATAEGLDRFRVTALEPAPLPATFGFYTVAGQPDGSIVIGTESDGLQKLIAGKIEKVQDVTLKRITSIMRSPDGKLWLGGVGDLGYLESNHFHAVAVPNDFKSPERDTQTMTIGPGGDLWVQTASKLEIERLHDGTWFPIRGSRRGSGGETLIMTTDHLGRVWAGFMNSVVKIFEGDKITVLDQSKGLVLGNVTALYDSGKEMWVGGEHGLDVMIAGKPVAAKFFGDTKIDGISGIVIMNDGSLWLNSLPGVARVPVEEVDKFRADPSHAMRYRLFNYLDGLAGEAPQVRTFPSIVRGAGSVLWFTTTNGAASIDAANISTNRTVPPVSIKRILIDGKLLDADRSITLPKGSQNLEIDYTALSLSVPERMLFRYRLEGYDREWQDAGSRRQAFYPHLPPGHYTFHVVACNNDGVWNDTGAVMAVYLPPTFLQSWYFKALLAIGVLSTFWLLYLFRVKRETSRVQARLYERFSERERIARDLHDTFF
jgi:ligand-binding sensor domain-containing protein